MIQIIFLTLLVSCIAPAAVFACEGECIVGITNAFLGNYSAPVNNVLLEIANEIAENLIPPHAHTSEPISYLSPLIDAYSDVGYDNLRIAIFPRYFHGKCQVNGVNPKGCPNPNCPVVCGTPGSLVHFYDQLRKIAFNETRETLRELSQPGGSVFKRILATVKADAKRKTPRMIRVYGKPPNAVNSDITPPYPISRTSPKFHLTERAGDIEEELESILAQIPDRLDELCGGTGEDGLDGLEGCSWEDAMKEFILSFP